MITTQFTSRSDVFGTDKVFGLRGTSVVAGVKPESQWDFNTVKEFFILGALRYDRAQALTDAQKAAAQQNLDVPSNSTLSSTVLGIVGNSALRFDASQSLTSTQRIQARSNLDVYSTQATSDLIDSKLATNVLRTDVAQTLGSTAQAQARTNLDVFSTSEVTTKISTALLPYVTQASVDVMVDDALLAASTEIQASAILYNRSQSLLSTQQAQAYSNLGFVQGQATLVAGAVAVSLPSVKSTSKIFLTVATAGGTQGTLRTSRVAGTSFTITSTSNTETSVIDYLVILN